MYTDQDLDDAVAAGVLDPAAVAAFRAHVDASRGVSQVDEEQFRLITGFNDVFVVIASALVLTAVGWIASFASQPLSGAAVAAAAWGLAEYFTRRRRMALPSIVLLLSFVGAVFWCAWLLLESGRGLLDTPRAALAGAVAAGAAWLHWRRFHVPITVAAGAVALGSVVLVWVIAALPERGGLIHATVFGVGLAMFALAMWWDLSDPERRTQRSDVAFWLHLVAAPLLVQPTFMLVQLLGAASDLLEALVVVLVYFAIGVVALAIDRRALLVSALAFLLSALGGLFEAFGTVGPNLALAALVVGGALLLLSAFWDHARRLVVRQLPADWRDRLPRLDPVAG